MVDKKATAQALKNKLNEFDALIKKNPALKTILAPTVFATIENIRQKINAATQPPAQTITYIVKSGDTISEIAAQYDTTTEAIAKLNKIANPSAIEIGQKLIIPSKSNATPPTPKPATPTPTTPAADKYGIGAEKTDTYDSQRDNTTFSDKIGNYTETVIPDHQCNVTSITMMLINLADGDKNKVLALTKDLLKKHKIGINPAWGLPEMLGTFLHRELNASVFVNGNYFELYKYFPQLVKSAELLHPSSTQIFETKITPALKKGSEIIFSGHFTDSGHICSLLGVRNDGIVINDPFGCFSGVQNVYILNNDGFAAQKLQRHDATIKRRLSLNGRYDELKQCIASGKRVPSDIGKENFYTWDDIFNVGFKWLHITHKT